MNGWDGMGWDGWIRWDGVGCDGWMDGWDGWDAIDGMNEWMGWGGMAGWDGWDNSNNNTLYFKLATIIAAMLGKANYIKKNKQQYYINF